MQADKKPRHYVTIPVTKEDIIQCFICSEMGFPFLTEKGSINKLQRLKVKGIPKDAKPIYGWFDAARTCFFITMEHPDFKPVPFGQAPPVIDCEIDKIYCDHEGKFIKCESEPIQGSQELPSQPSF